VIVSLGEDLLARIRRSTEEAIRAKRMTLEIVVFNRFRV